MTLEEEILGGLYKSFIENTVEEFATLFDFKKRSFTGSAKITDQNYYSIKNEILTGNEKYSKDAP
jgi:hypothetical protein